MSNAKHNIGPFTTKEAANIVGVSATRIRQLAAENLIEHEKYGRTIVITAVGIEQAKQRNSKPGPTGPRKNVDGRKAA